MYIVFVYECVCYGTMELWEGHDERREREGRERKRDRVLIFSVVVCIVCECLVTAMSRSRVCVDGYTDVFEGSCPMLNAYPSLIMCQSQSLCVGCFSLSMY